MRHANLVRAARCVAVQYELRAALYTATPPHRLRSGSRQRPALLIALAVRLGGARDCIRGRRDRDFPQVGRSDCVEGGLRLSALNASPRQLAWGLARR